MPRSLVILLINILATFYYIFAIVKLFHLPNERLILNQMLHAPWYIFGLLAQILGILAFESHRREHKLIDDKSPSTLLWQASFIIMYLQLDLGYALAVTANWIISLQTPTKFYIVLLLLAILPGLLYSFYLSGHFGRPWAPLWVVRLTQLAVIVNVGAHMYNSIVAENCAGRAVSVLMLFHILFVSLSRDYPYIQEINLLLPCFISILMLSALGCSIRRSAWIMAEKFSTV